MDCVCQPVSIHFGLGTRANDCPHASTLEVNSERRSKVLRHGDEVRSPLKVRGVTPAGNDVGVRGVQEQPATTESVDPGVQERRSS